MSAEAAAKPEIVIIRRRPLGEDAPLKGGVWKIAFADFMTAMMAFFLVMWLVNASSEKSRKDLATYFNPVQLTDPASGKKGVSDPQKNTTPADVQDQSGLAEQTKADNQRESSPAKLPGERKYTEEELFKDPYVVLAELAAEASQGSPGARANAAAILAENGQAGLTGGEAFRDPFDPLTWTDQPEPADNAIASGPAIAAAENQPPSQKPKPELPVLQRNIYETAYTVMHPPAIQAAGTVEAKPAAGVAEKLSPSADAAKPDTAVRREAAAIKAEILKQLGQIEDAGIPDVEIKAQREGILISLTDSVGFDMFAIGSAEPKPQLVAFMEKIAGVLKNRRGSIVVRGHTDGRPFHSDKYDNWRLSSARAQMAYYMLVRGGIPEAKIARIEGYADRDLKIPGDPQAAANRRIEILLTGEDLAP